jgi:hypothetical protein
MSTRGFEQRPTTPRIRTSGCFRSFARSAVVTMMALALSVSTQQSSRCSGLQIMRLLTTSSAVTRFL